MLGHLSAASSDKKARPRRILALTSASSPIYFHKYFHTSHFSWVDNFDQKSEEHWSRNKSKNHVYILRDKAYILSNCKSSVLKLVQLSPLSTQRKTLHFILSSARPLQKQNFLMEVNWGRSDNEEIPDNAIPFRFQQFCAILTFFGRILNAAWSLVSVLADRS